MTPFQRFRRRATSVRVRSRASSVFLKLGPSRRMKCQTALWDTLTPRFASMSFRPCSVRCGVRLIRSRIKSRWGSRIILRWPPILPGATLPVSRYRWRHLITEGTEVVLLFWTGLGLSQDASGLGFMPLGSSVSRQSMRRWASVYQARCGAAQRCKIRSSRR